MARDPYYEDYFAQQNALTRLRARFFPTLSPPAQPSAIEVMRRLSTCLMAHAPDNPLCLTQRERSADFYPLPDVDDLAAGLTFAGEARRRVDHNELRLIDAAVAADGDWQRIGTTLGYPTATAARDARAHRRRLATKLGVRGAQPAPQR